MDSPKTPLNQAEQHLKSLAVLARYAALRAVQTETPIRASIEGPERRWCNEQSDERYH